RVGLAYFAFPEPSDRLDRRQCFIAERSREPDLLPPPRSGVKQISPLHGLPQHLFQAKALSAKLEFIVDPAIAPTLLVLHRVDLAVPLLDDIGFAADTQAPRVEINAAQLQGFSLDTSLAAVRPLMLEGSFHRVF